MSPMIKKLAAAAVLCVAVIAGYFWMTDSNANATGSAATETEATAGEFGITEMSLGNPEAAVTIVEYASFTCPHCGTFHNGPFKQLKADYIDTGKINFVYREVYFDRPGLWASMVARCAAPDKFFGIIDLVYKDQSGWARAGEPAQIIESLRKIGRLAGMDDATMDACLNDGDKAENLMAWWQANQEADAIRSTPSFVIDGTLHSNQSYEDMKALIDAALEG